MTLDAAMGGSTNTVLHLLAIAQEADVGFGMSDIDRISRLTPCLCKVAPSSHYHLEDVGRAGGIFTILGALERAGRIDSGVGSVHVGRLGDAIAKQDIRRDGADDSARRRALAAPGGVRTVGAFLQDCYFDAVDADFWGGGIR